MNFAWGNFFSTLAGAGFGALGVFYFNLKLAEKQQKEIEKSKLLKLFYDFSILAKTFVYYHENIVAEINNQTNSELKSFIPITLKDTNFQIDEYGFITKLSPKLYEILTYAHHDINYIYEQENIVNEFLCKNVNLDIYLIKLEHIKISIIKLLAKLFVNLVNINNILNKYYGCKNLIKEESINSYIRAKKIIDRTLKEYQKIINNPDSKNAIDREDFITIQLDFEYINEILNTWIIDFGLNNKQKTIIETEINTQVENRWEASENDL